MHIRVEIFFDRPSEDGTAGPLVILKKPVSPHRRQLLSGPDGCGILHSRALTQEERIARYFNYHEHNCKASEARRNNLSTISRHQSALIVLFNTTNRNLFLVPPMHIVSRLDKTPRPFLLGRLHTDCRKYWYPALTAKTINKKRLPAMPTSASV